VWDCYAPFSVRMPELGVRAGRCDFNPPILFEYFDYRPGIYDV